MEAKRGRTRSSRSSRSSVARWCDVRLRGREQRVVAVREVDGHGHAATGGRASSQLKSMRVIVGLPVPEVRADRLRS